MPEYDHPMKITLAVLLLAAMSFAASHHELQAAKLIDVSADERLIEGTSYRHAIYKVEIGDLLISARGERMRIRGGDAGHGLIVGDPVQAAVEGDELYLQRPDGKEIKAKIIERKRAGTP
jgi:hypothetical protein